MYEEVDLPVMSDPEPFYDATKVASLGQMDASENMSQCSSKRARDNQSRLSKLHGGFMDNQ